MANAYLSPIGNEQQSDSNGAPLSGGKILTYQAGTTTLAATYMDSSAAVGQQNPVPLNASGLPSNPIFLTAGQAYKFVFQDANGVTLRTVDGITGVGDPTNAAANDQWLLFAGLPTYISATSFSVGGDQTNLLQVKRRIKTANTGGTVHSSIVRATYSPGTGLTTVVLANDSGSLDSGLSQVSYSLLSATNPAVPVLSGTDGTLSFRNRLHNGSFRINQRGVSGTVTLAAGAHGHDRWKAGASGCTYTFVASGSGNVLTITAGSLVQVVEGADVEGGIYALSNQGTAQARIAVNGAATSGSYAAATTASPVLSASATGGAAVTVEFSTGTLDRIQLEPGSVATTFERRPMQVELALCQRYFQSGSARWDGQVTSGVTFSTPAIFKVSMRTTPTLTQTSAGATSVSTTTGSAFLGVDGFFDTRSGSVTGAGAWITNWTASADL